MLWCRATPLLPGCCWLPLSWRKRDVAERNERIFRGAFVVQLTTQIVYAELWLVSVDAPVRQEVFGTSPQTNHLKRSDILKFAHQTCSVNVKNKCAMAKAPMGWWVYVVEDMISIYNLIQYNIIRIYIYRDKTLCLQTLQALCGIFSPIKANTGTAAEGSKFVQLL